MECNVYDRKDYGGFWRRYFADFFDGIFLAIAFAIVNAITEDPIAILILNIMIFLTYMIGFKGARGTTPGYWILGIKIVSINDPEVTDKQIVVRLISAFFSALAFGLGFIWIAFDKNKQAWHDKVAGTYVIRTRATPVRTIELPQTGLIRGKLFAALALTSLPLFIGLFGGIMYSIKGSDATYLNRGVTYFKKRQYEQAISNYNKAIEINPRYAEAYNNRGKVYGIKGQYEKAISDFTKAIEIDPRKAYAYMLRAKAWEKRGDLDRAIADFSKALEIDPRPTDPRINTYYWRGRTWEMKGDHGRAIADLNKALEIHPRHANASNALAWILATCSDARYRDGVKAVKLAKKAVELEPQYSGFWDTLASAYAEADRFEDAMKTQEKAIALLKKEDETERMLEFMARLNSYKGRKPWREK